MPLYKQTVRFEKTFEIVARDAQEANEQIAEAVQQIEWESEVEAETLIEFDDDPVECPECKGYGLMDDDETPCRLCDGEGTVPFTAE